MDTTKPRETIDRRTFLRSSLLSGLAAFSLPPALLRAQCALTTDDILGPYYVENPPVRTVIAAADEPGRRLMLTGRVFARDCITPLEGAIVDIWQANDAGCYSVLQTCQPNLLEQNLRGQTLTNAAGEYAFETIVPGFYLNGAQYRPAHIHARIVPPQGPTLITQVYFEGDPYIANDPWASAPDAARRIIPLAEHEGILRGEMNFFMDSDVPVGVGDGMLQPDLLALHQNYPNPFAASTTIRYAIPQAGDITLAVYDTFGRMITVLDKARKAAGYYSIDWNGKNRYGEALAPGVYLYKLEIVTAYGRFDMMKHMVYLRP